MDTCKLYYKKNQRRTVVYCFSLRNQFPYVDSKHHHNITPCFMVDSTKNKIKFLLRNLNTRYGHIYDLFTVFLLPFLGEISYGTCGVRTWHSSSVIWRAKLLTTRPRDAARKVQPKWAGSGNRTRDQETEATRRTTQLNDTQFLMFLDWFSRTLKAVLPYKWDICSNFKVADAYRRQPTHK